MTIKSAYELAMERMGGGKEYSEAQKAQLAEIDAFYKARRAELELGAETRLKKAAGNAEEEEKIRSELAADLARLEEKKERDKEKVRNRQ